MECRSPAHPIRTGSKAEDALGMAGVGLLYPLTTTFEALRILFQMGLPVSLDKGKPTWNLIVGVTVPLALLVVKGVG